MRQKEDAQNIEKIILRGYSENLAHRVYQEAGKDIYLAFKILHDADAVTQKMGYFLADLVDPNQRFGLEATVIGNQMGFITGYRDQHRVELEMQKIQKSGTAQLKKKLKKRKTRRQAARAVIVSDKKRPVEMDRLLVNSYFKQELAKVDFSLYKAT